MINHVIEWNGHVIATWSSRDYELKIRLHNQLWFVTIKSVLIKLECELESWIRVIMMDHEIFSSAPSGGFPALKNYK